MGFRTEVEPLENAGTQSMAAKLVNENIAMTKHLRAQLPKNRDLLRKIYDYGLQSILSVATSQERRDPYRYSRQPDSSHSARSA